MALLFATGFWLKILAVTIDGGFHDGTIFFTIMLPIVGYFVFNTGFKRIYFYSNGVQIKYLLPSIFNKNCTYKYSEIIFIEFEESLNANNNGSCEIRLLEQKKIKTYLFTSYFERDQVKRLADILVEKKVAVKLNSFEY